MSRTKFLCALALLGLPALAADQATAIPISLVQTQTIGMVGLAHGQTARVNLLNLGGPSPLVTTTTGPSCSAQIDFLDDQGFLLKTQVLNVPPGKSLPYDLDRDTDISSSSPRVEIRAVIRFPSQTAGVNQPQISACSLQPTLEVFDNNDSKTLLIIVGLRVSLGPVPLAAAM